MIESFKHKGLKRLYEKDDRGGLRPDLVAKIQQILSALDAAETPDEMDLAMKNPCHPGQIIRSACLDGLHLNVTEGAAALGVTRTTLSRILNGKASVSPEMAVRLSKAFGSTTGFWLRLQLNYDLAQVEKKAPRIHVRRVEVPVEELSIP
jgi:antitoxin HigA-1